VTDDRARELQVIGWRIMLDHFPHQNGTFIDECRAMLEEVIASRARFDAVDRALVAYHSGYDGGGHWDSGRLVNEITAAVAGTTEER
jgi:hypothetical protein